MSDLANRQIAHSKTGKKKHPQRDHCFIQIKPFASSFANVQPEKLKPTRQNKAEISYFPIVMGQK